MSGTKDLPACSSHSPAETRVYFSAWLVADDSCEPNCRVFRALLHMLFVLVECKNPGREIEQKMQISRSDKFGECQLTNSNVACNTKYLVFFHRCL